MTESTAAIQVRTRRIVHRTFGDRHGPITPYGQKIKTGGKTGSYPIPA